MGDGYDDDNENASYINIVTDINNEKAILFNMLSDLDNENSLEYQ